MGVILWILGIVAVIFFIVGVISLEEPLVSVGIIFAIIWLVLFGISKAYQATNVVRTDYRYTQPELVVRSSNSTFVIAGTVCLSDSTIQFYTADTNNIFFETATGYNKKGKVVYDGRDITVGKPHEQNLERPER